MKKFNIKNTLIALACTLVFAHANAMEIDPNQFTILNLPDHELLEVLIHLENNDIASTARTCSHLAGVVRNQATQNLMLIKKIKSDIDQLIPDIRNQADLDISTDVNQLNTILKNLKIIDLIRANPNNSIFAEEERKYLYLLLKRDYVDFFQAQREEADAHNNLLRFNEGLGEIILDFAIPMDSDYAVSFLISYINPENYTPLFNAQAMLESALTHNSIKTINVLLKNQKSLNINLNTPNSRNKTILDIAQEQSRYKLKHMRTIEETSEPVIEKIIALLLAHGAKTSTELPTEQLRHISATPPKLPRRTGRRGR